MEDTGRDASLPQGPFLLYGGTGWIGGHIKRILTEEGSAFVEGKARLENREDLLRLLCLS